MSASSRTWCNAASEPANLPQWSALRRRRRSDWRLRSRKSRATLFNTLAAGGLSCRLRDLARFGEMIRLDGRLNGRQIVPAAVVADIRKGGSKAAFAGAGYKTLPGASYHNQWWVLHDEHGAFAARGIHGQGIYVDPKAEMVIARFASSPVAGNVGLDPTTLPAYRALARHLMAKPR